MKQSTLGTAVGIYKGFAVLIALQDRTGIPPEISLNLKAQGPDPNDLGPFITKGNWIVELQLF